MEDRQCAWRQALSEAEASHASLEPPEARGRGLRWDLRIGTCLFLKVMAFRVPCLFNSVSQDSLVISDRKQTQTSLSINKVLLKKTCEKPTDSRWR